MEFIFTAKLEITENRSEAGNCTTPQFPGQLLPQEMNLQDKLPGNLVLWVRDFRVCGTYKLMRSVYCNKRSASFFAFC